MKMWSFMTDPANKDDVMVKSNAEVSFILRSNNGYFHDFMVGWQGVEKVKEEQGGFAFMMEDAGIQYLIERNCELAQVNLKQYSFIGKPGNTKMEFFLEKFQTAQLQTFFLHRLVQDWTQKAMGSPQDLAQALKTS